MGICPKEDGFDMQDIRSISDELGIGRSVAKELLTLAHGDQDLVLRESYRSESLSLCKARIIDKRLEEREDDSGIESQRDNQEIPR